MTGSPKPVNPAKPPAAPLFSVIIATYNWSSALRLALESVLLQTVGDFEVLVVGDRCYDDSQEMVAALGDPRVRWFNLLTHHGSPWAPNNHGLMMARGRYVAYLGHDDLWWPTHLERALAAFERSDADVVAAAALSYGPPGSGVHTVTGFFPNDVFTPRYCFPASSMLHRKEVLELAGAWRSPVEADCAVDVDFLARCHAAGARIVPTGDFTTFRFNAAWRRDAYRTRETHEQRHFLARMQREGESFRMEQLAEALRSAVEDRLPRAEIDPAMMAQKAVFEADLHRAFKGSRRANAPAATFKTIGDRRRYPIPLGYAGLEWHPEETHPDFGTFRWSGPARTACIVLPEPVAAPTRLTLMVLNWIHEDVLAGAVLSVNGVAIASSVSDGPDGTRLLSGTIVPDQLPAADRFEMRVAVTVPRTWRPLDVGLGDDRRWVGLAVGWIESGPVPAAAPPQRLRPAAALR